LISMLDVYEMLRSAKREYRKQSLGSKITPYN
jgi:hypothetical protein